jgi:hypothetical protein
MGFYLDEEDEIEEKRQEIGTYLEEGCWTRTDILRFAGEDVEHLDPTGLNKLIDEEIQSRRSDETRFPAVTDVDRIYSAFKALEDAGIMALHAPASTPSSCFAEAKVQWDKHGGPSSPIWGVVFYNPQDIQRALAAYQFWVWHMPFLGHPNFEGVQDSDADERVALAAVAALQAEGLKVRRGNIEGNDKSIVVDMPWQKRFDAEAFEQSDV